MSIEADVWLSEHLPYELKMMRHSGRSLLAGGMHYLDWNAHLASFAVAVCNLADFLTNGGKGSTVKAKDLVPDFRSRKDDLSGAFQKLEPQVFHLGKNRASNDTSKFSVDDVKSTSEWIEIEMTKFLAKLEEQAPKVREKWDEALSQPEPVLRGSIFGGSSQSTSTADPQFSSTSFPRRWDD